MTISTLVLNKPYQWNDLDYNLNSQGYRCPEFEMIKWEESTVILGCSLTFGAGVNSSNTIDFFLSKLLQEPVINLGVIGTGPDFVRDNLIRLHSQNIKPKRVIVYWPWYHRWYYIKKNSTQIVFPRCDTLCWCGSGDAKNSLEHETHWRETSKLCKLCAYSLYGDILFEFNRPDVQNIIDAFPDEIANDGLHPTGVVNERIAQWIYSNLV